MHKKVRCIWGGSLGSSDMAPKYNTLDSKLVVSDRNAKEYISKSRLN
jgi:hypothetical protein